MGGSHGGSLLESWAKELKRWKGGMKRKEKWGSVQMIQYSDNRRGKEENREAKTQWNNLRKLPTVKDMNW